MVFKLFHSNRNSNDKTKVKKNKIILSEPIEGKTNPIEPYEVEISSAPTSLSNSPLKHSTSVEHAENDMTQDLMILIGHAIDEWAVKYNLTNLPKNIIFEQALCEMKEVHKSMKP